MPELQQGELPKSPGSSPRMQQKRLTKKAAHRAAFVLVKSPQSISSITLRSPGSTK